MIKIKKSILLDYWGVLMLILCSGSLILTGISYGIAMGLLSITSLLFLVNDGSLVNERRLHIPSVEYFFLFIFLIFANAFIIHPNVVDSMWVSTILNCVFSFIIICRYPFYRFKRIYIDIVSVIALISIIIFYGCEWGIFIPKQMAFKEAELLVYMGHIVGWGNQLFNRNASVFHEPGAFQYYLNFALIFLLPEIINSTLNKSGKVRLAIIIVALITTFSTMAYLAFFGIVSLAFFYSKFAKRHRRLYPCIILSIIGFFYLVASTSVVSEKVAGNEYGEEHISKIQRTQDFITQTQMTFEKPILGYGIHTVEFVERNYGNVGGCIGLFNTSASLGMIWLIVFVIYAYKAIKKMRLGVPSMFVLFIFLVIECNETYVELPVTYLFIMHFLDYKYIDIFPKNKIRIRD